MSTPAPRQGPVRPPEKGAFPLDHLKECTEIAAEYQKCLREQKSVSFRCRELARKYLDCRMKAGLMAESEWDELGFREKDSDLKVKEFSSGGKAMYAGMKLQHERETQD
mmetsp:Transcript_28821/g.112310  ORF Transcript_28821/g.112310 Transcript_28821/m.112310 type:complete len:109 (-) Transcript_28821:1637-1963(-)|eukprot:CAMPEP_0113954896 /NCGR_PEP_ID=MMETSP0011_2-20120614/927_1 /TAXON_ID=101924 /ORGANISM="Rhodosorus marinus" /LENGTH=108 /DNA_ID=CAMNT_0000964315 /DNA_START=42 /DNA_END=368 /DNA_ORIENTATION=- /assembly_acc=CAM_ASM_000156